MAFDGKVAVHVLNHISSLDTDDIRDVLDQPQCITILPAGIKDTNWKI
jgi:hypothetical protein